MTATEKLDAVLNFMYDNIGSNFAVLQLEERMGNPFLKSEMFLICLKLHDDKNSFRFDSEKYGTLQFTFGISFEGKIFKEAGGYGQTIINKHAENTRMATLESSQTLHRRWMTALTIILAVGTSIAAWYYLTELLHFYACGKSF